jgi:hypothetical protein
MMYGLQNYATTEEQGQTALETLARDAREADIVASVSTNSLVLSNSSGLTTYTFNPTAQNLTRTATNSIRTLLKSCTQIQFNLYQRCSSTNTYDQFPAATASTAKLVEVIWKCATTNAHNPLN